MGVTRTVDFLVLITILSISESDKKLKDFKGFFQGHRIFVTGTIPTRIYQLATEKIAVSGK